MSRQTVALHAKHPSFAAMPRTVVVLAFDELLLLNAAGPLEVFAAIPRLLGGTFASHPPYRLLLVSPAGGPITSVSGISVNTLSLAQLDRQAPVIDTLIVAGGPGVSALEASVQVCSWLRSRAGSIRRLCSIGTGTFALAAAGLLDGRKVVTHWKFAEQLQARYPTLQCQGEGLYLHDANLWTCAGAAAGIDLALGLVEQDLGAHAALELARYFTVFLWRSAKQPQLSASLNAQSRALRTDPDVRLVRLHAWIAANLQSDLRVEKLAEQFGMSPRHFARAYVATTGHTPAQAVELLRLDAACQLLKNTSEPIKRIAETAGFGRRSACGACFTSSWASARTITGTRAHALCCKTDLRAARILGLTPGQRPCDGPAPY